MPTATQTSNDTAADNGTVKKVNRRSFTERLSDLSLEEKVQVVKDLKVQIAEELAKRQASAADATKLAEGL